ncbi:hypothetical protein K525DRAFT_246792 [Schizophyllum commune Loenen D]|nr:hypothetical protein K525DRAFT_246792 [Schizophyllum commune Loenen D]
MPFAATLPAFVRIVLERFGIVAATPTAPTRDDASVPSSLGPLAQRSGTDTTQSDGSASDSDGSDGSPRFRGNSEKQIAAGAGKKKTDKKKGKPTCAAFNSKKGCSVQKCMADHLCNACYSKHSVVNCGKK